MMSVFSALSNLAALVVFVVDMVLWGIVRKRLRGVGATAQYGNANWLTLGALVALAVGYCVAACAIFGNYRRRKYSY
jgi:low affinity Fe/Cu permease